MNYKYYYDNYMYNCIKVEQVLNFEVYNVTAKISMIYANTIEYSNFLLFGECKKLFAANWTRVL